MKTKEDFRDLFNKLSPCNQTRLLDDLLQEHELKGTILKSAEEEVVLKRKKKTCPHCESKSVYKGKEEVNVVQVVTAVERNGERYLKAVESKRLSKDEIAKVLDGKLEDGTTLITDKHPSYKSYAK